jgi:hypothetical protein
MRSRSRRFRQLDRVESRRFKAAQAEAAPIQAHTHCGTEGTPGRKPGKLVESLGRLARYSEQEASGLGGKALEPGGERRSMPSLAITGAYARVFRALVLQRGISPRRALRQGPATVRRRRVAGSRGSSALTGISIGVVIRVGRPWLTGQQRCNFHGKCHPLALIDAPVFNGSNHTAPARKSSVGPSPADLQLGGVR